MILSASNRNVYDFALPYEPIDFTIAYYNPDEDIPDTTVPLWLILTIIGVILVAIVVIIVVQQIKKKNAGRPDQLGDINLSTNNLTKNLDTMGDRF